MLTHLKKHGPKVYSHPYAWVSLMAIHALLLSAYWFFQNGIGLHLLLDPLPPTIAGAGIVTIASLLIFLDAFSLKLERIINPAAIWLAVLIIPFMLLVFLVSGETFEQSLVAFTRLFTLKQLWWWAFMIITIALFPASHYLLMRALLSENEKVIGAAFIWFLMGMGAMISKYVSIGGYVLFVGVFLSIPIRKWRTLYPIRSKLVKSPATASIPATAVTHTADEHKEYQVTYGLAIPTTDDNSRPIGQTRWPAMISITGPPDSGAAPMLADLLCQHWDMGSKGQRVLLTTDWLTLVELAHRIEVERLTAVQVFIPQGKRPYGYDPIGAVNHQPEQWAERLRHWLGAPSGDLPEEKRLAHLLYFAALLAYEGVGETVALADVAEALHNDTQRQTWLAHSQPGSTPWEATPLTRLAVGQFWERTFPGWPATVREQLTAQAKQMLAPYRLPDTAVADWPLTGKSDWPLTAVPFTWTMPDTEPGLIAIYLPPTCGQLALDWSKALLSDIVRRGTPPLVAWADPAGRFSPAEMADWLHPFEEQASSLIQFTPPKRELRAWWGTKRDWALVQFTTVQHRFWPGRHVARIGWMEWAADRPQEKPARSSWRLACRALFTAMAQRPWPLVRPQNKPTPSSWQMVFHTVSTAMAQRPRQLYRRDPLAGLRHQLAYATPAEREARRQALLQPDSDLTPFDRRQLLLAGWGQL